MDFPLAYPPSPEECYQFLISLLHPEGLQCPEGHSLATCKIHRRNRAPIIDYRCNDCGRIFNIFSGTVLKGTKYNVTQIIQCFDGMVSGTPITRLAKEMKVDRKSLGKTCIKIKDLVAMEQEDNSQLNWFPLLREIEWWEIEDQYEGGEGQRLVVKIKQGPCFALAKMTFERIHPQTLGRKVEKYTDVKPLGKNYFKKKYTPEY